MVAMAPPESEPQVGFGDEDMQVEEKPVQEKQPVVQDELQKEHSPRKN